MFVYFTQATNRKGASNKAKSLRITAFVFSILVTPAGTVKQLP